MSFSRTSLRHHAGRILAVFAASVCLHSTSLALVDPEVRDWHEMVVAAQDVSRVPGSELFPEALAALGELGSALAKAPLAETMSELEERRDLKFLYFTPWHVKNKDELRAFLKVQMAKDFGPQKVIETEALLKSLGLAPLDFELIPFLEDLYTSQIAGAYDPESDQFFLVDNQGGQSVRSKLVAKATNMVVDSVSTVTIHELDHALGGQHFPLKKVFQSSKDWSTDRQMGVLALIEGDATFVMIDHQKKTPPESMGAMTEIVNADLLTDMVGMLAEFPIPLPGMGVFKEAPLYYQKSLIFPYYSGAEFVSALRSGRDDWSDVNAAYSDLPTGTEQIYHPDEYQYLVREPDIPDFKALPKSLGAWDFVVDDTGGEFLLRIVLEQYGVKDPATAASGWHGDRIRVYRNGKTGALAFYWAIRWDDAREAEEFYDSLGWSLPFVVERDGRDFFLSLAFTPQELSRLRAAIVRKP